MKTIHPSLHALHDGGMELHRGELVPCFEMPARVDHILAAIARALGGGGAARVRRCGARGVCRSMSPAPKGAALARRLRTEW